MVGTRYRDIVVVAVGVGMERKWRSERQDEATMVMKMSALSARACCAVLSE